MELIKADLIQKTKALLFCVNIGCAPISSLTPSTIKEVLSIKNVSYQYTTSEGNSIAQTYTLTADSLANTSNIYKNI